MATVADSFALVLTGGGARAAYQVGVLRCLARHLPSARFDIITGVSAGAINAAFLASRHKPLPTVVEELSEVWRTLQLKDVIRIDSKSLARNVFGWSTKSQDLGKLAAEYEPQLPRAFRFLTRSLGTQETSNADFMSLFMFVPEYLQRLIDIGEADAEAKIAAIVRVAMAPSQSRSG